MLRNSDDVDASIGIANNLRKGSDDMTDKKQVDVGTEAVWAGEKEYLVHGATQVPVVLSVAYNYDDMDEWYDVAIGKKKGHIYGRNTNPTDRPGSSGHKHRGESNRKDRNKRKLDRRKKDPQPKPKPELNTDELVTEVVRRVGDALPSDVSMAVGTTA